MTSSTNATVVSAREPAATPSRRPLVVVALGLVGALLFPLFVSTASAQARTTPERTIAAAVTKLINRERHAHHLHAVKANKHLVSSARSHNLAMAHANTMAHQVKGESQLGRRLDRAGYHWTMDGENIGYNKQMTRSGVLMLEKAMYNERAPFNGHRLNILNKHFRHVGVDVYFDPTHHKVWLTVDFGKK